LPAHRKEKANFGLETKVIASVAQFVGTSYTGATGNLPARHTEDTQEEVTLLSEKSDRDFLA